MQKPVLSCILIMDYWVVQCVLAHSHHHEKVQTQAQRDAANGILRTRTFSIASLVIGMA
ncbi:hypothetical protein [Proteus sp. CD3]|uniref:hypothetical protein n=1 Tax=Proteus sp. CD3 TaxID=1921565 RepID=UPI00223EAD02|nr:hypothetical protein [Proteus sp. CD3]